MVDKCYICGKNATTKEHVPPKCFFPEAKDSDGKDYKKNLITVPSCEEHNLNKSHDDAYLFYVVLSSYNNNIVAFNQFMTKASRAFERKPALLGIYKEKCPATINGEATKAFKVDMERINIGFELISKGIYFHHLGSICSKSVIVHIPKLYSHRNRTNEILTDILVRANILFQSIDTAPAVCGNNPDVFRYQFYTDNTKNVDLLKMVYYGGFEVITVFQ